MMHALNPSWSSVVKGSHDEENLSPQLEPNLDVSQLRMQWPTYQENGQKKYGPPSWWSGPAPPKGTEVFLSRLPRQVNEYDLCPLLSKVGIIYTFRLMMDFSGSNRGFGFVQYTTREEALRAIRELHNYPIRQNARISVEESLDNCRLYLSHIPRGVTDLQLRDTLGKHLSGVKDVTLHKSARNLEAGRVFCFVEFVDHRSAAMGRRFLLSSGIPEWREWNIGVDWAIPVPETPPEVMEKVTSLYIRNLSPSTNKDRILQLCVSRSINVNFITSINKMDDYAFVHFENKSVATYALKILDGVVLDGSKLKVCWAKPPPYKAIGAAHSNGSSIENIDSVSRDLNTNRRDSFGSAHGSVDSTLVSAPTIMHRYSALCATRDQLATINRKSESSSGNGNSPAGSSSSLTGNWWCDSKDEGYVTEDTMQPAACLPQDQPPTIFINNAYSSLMKKYGLPIDGDSYPVFEDYRGVPPWNALRRATHHVFQLDSSRAASSANDGSDISDEVKNDFVALNRFVKGLMSKHGNKAYEVVRILAQEFNWGLVCVTPLEAHGKWTVALRLLKDGTVKDLTILMNPCNTLIEALNEAALIFLRDYIVNLEGFRFARVFFFP